MDNSNIFSPNTTRALQRVCFFMETKRPTYNDPAEFALIKEIYFYNDKLAKEEVEPIERLERMQSKQRNTKSNR